MKLVIVTGVSGAGKTTALRALEDLGFYCVDNLPIPLLPTFVDLLAAGRHEIARAALVIDARGGEFLEDSRKVLAGLRAAGQPIDILFLDAPDDVLIRRFSETRRRHPLSGIDIRAGLLAERLRLEPLRQEATMVVETTQLNVHGLRALVLERYGQAEGSLSVSFLSFGFKHGLPVEADIVLDVRFLPNPYFVEGLSPLSGQEEPVRAYVLERPEAQEFLNAATNLLQVCLQGFVREGKSYATVAIGCTGGRHRSVVLANELGRRFSDEWSVRVRHRDIDKTRRPSGV